MGRQVEINNSGHELKCCFQDDFRGFGENLGAFFKGLVYETHLNNCNYLNYVSKFIEEFDASNTIYR